MPIKRKRRPVEEEEELPPEENDDDEDEERELKIYRVVPEKPRIKMLVYSEPGAGKTTLAATAQKHPDLAPVLFANVEGGVLSIAYRRDIHAVDIASTAELERLYYKLKRREGLFAKIKTVVIDNATELQTLNLDEIVHKEVSRNKGGNRESVDDIWQDDYGTSTTQLARLFRWFKGLDINLIITAHAKFVYPPSGRKSAAALVDAEPLTVLPMITQKLCKTMMGMVDFVWFLQYDPDSKDRHMLTRPDGIYQAKTRGPRFARALGPVVTNPTMPKLYDLLVRADSGSSKKTTKEE